MGSCGLGIFIVILARGLSEQIFIDIVVDFLDKDTVKEDEGF